jgi:hypothetical protein
MAELVQARCEARHALPSAVARKRWRDARQFQVHAQEVLASVGVPFVQWVVLESLRELSLERRDAATPTRVAERTGLSRMVTSYWLILLDEKGLIDRAARRSGNAYLVLLSPRGEETLRQCNERLGLSGLLG